MENFDRKLPLTEGRRGATLLPKDLIKCKINNFMEKTKNTWGGARNYPKGSGLREVLTCRVDPVTMARIKGIAERYRISIGKAVDLVVSRFTEHGGAEDI